MRLVDADALFIEAHRKWINQTELDVSEIIKMIISAPTIDALPVLQGKWRKLGVDEYVCTNCWRHSDWHTAWCPECGAKMELE